MNQGTLLDVDPHARREDDFYRTPGWMTLALLRRIYLARWVVIEPCVGDGAIVRRLPDECDRVVTNDITARAPMVPDFLLDATRAESWARFLAVHGHIDLTLTNPPFNDTFDMMQHALKASRQGVIILQRCTWIEPTDERGDWLAAHPPDAQIIMPRWNFRSLNGKGGSDSAPPSWFIWNRAVQICRPGIHVVSKSERDELIGKAA